MEPVGEGVCRRVGGGCEPGAVRAGDVRGAVHIGVVNIREVRVGDAEVVVDEVEEVVVGTQRQVAA